MSLLTVTTVEIPASLLGDTLRRLRETGMSGREMFVFWAGAISGSTALVKSVVVPWQSTYNRGGMCWVDVPAVEVKKMMLDLSTSELTLIGQVHSHPGRAFHSDRDDALSIARLPGSLSVVVPNFARAPFSSVTQFACYRRTVNGQWRRMEDGEAQQLIRVR